MSAEKILAFPNLIFKRVSTWATIKYMKVLSESLIKKLAGSAVYVRGVSYFDAGLVGTLKISNGRIRADVEGTYVYRVTLRHTAKIFEGSCDCPASENFDFCKHCVAVALHYYYQTQSQTELTDLASNDRLKKYLTNIPKEDLAQHFIDLLSEDAALYDRWMLKVELATNTIKPADIKKRITKAIPYKNDGLWGYHEVGNYFSMVELALEQYLPIIESMDTSAALKLIDYGFQRLSKTLETIDDSGGYRFTTETMLAETFTNVLQNSAWLDAQKGDYIAELILTNTDRYDTLNLPESVLDILGEEGSIAMFSKVSAHWESLQPPKQNADWSETYAYQKLQNIVIMEAQSRGDVNRELIVRAKSASNINDFVKLVELCLQHNRIPEAEEWQQRAEKLATRQGTDHLVIASQIKLWRAQKKYPEILALRWNSFTSSASSQRLKEVLKASKAVKNTEDYLEKGIAHVKDELFNASDEYNRIRMRSVLAEILLDNKRSKDALSVCQAAPIANHVLQRIILSNIDQILVVLPLMIRSVNATVSRTNNDAYKEAIKLIQKIAKAAGNEYNSEFDRAVREIAQTNKAKRNFIKWLKEKFSID